MSDLLAGLDRLKSRADEMSARFDAMTASFAETLARLDAIAAKLAFSANPDATNPKGTEHV
jgi:hypothetical protein